MIPFPNLRVAAAAVTNSTWNPADKSANINLSPDKNTATGNGTSSGYFNARGTRSANSGLIYFEVSVMARANDAMVGIANASADLNAFLGVDTNSIAYQGTGNILYNSSVPATQTGYGTGAIIQVASNLSSRKIWFGLNGTFVGNPAAGTGGYSLPSGDSFPAVSLRVSDSFALNTGGSAFAYTPPSGFSAWG